MDDVLEQLQRLQKSIKLKLCISMRLHPSKSESPSLKGISEVTRVHMSDELESRLDIDGTFGKCCISANYALEE